MVSYYNPMPYSQKHSAANLAYTAGQPWQWSANYHTPPNQFLGDMDSPHAAAHYYPHAMFHAAGASEWHSPTSSAEHFPQNAPIAHQQMLQQQHQHHIAVSAASNAAASNNVGGGGGSSSSVSSAGSSSTPGNTQLNETTSSIGDAHIAEGLPSPPITVSGSEISSPGAPATSSSPHHASHHLGNNNNHSPSTNHNNNNSATHNNNNNNNRSSPLKGQQYYDWMKKPSYPAQPTPGKTRTKDKYRVVYTDYQRLELEKEYCTSRYITIRRKTELAQSLSLSERQVKIWFQNRRAKERKQTKKGSDSSVMGGVQHGDYLMDTKPKLEHLHSLHSMAAMSMPTMSIHHLHSHHSLAAAHSHQLHQSTHSQMSAAAAAAAAGVGSLM